MFRRILSNTENFTSFAPEELPHSEMKLCYQQWQDLKDEAKCGIPKLSRFFLDRLGPTLSHCTLVYLYEENDYEPFYMQAGDDLNKLYGMNIENKYLNELFSKKLSEEPRKIYNRVRTEKTPIFSRRIAKTWLNTRGYDRLLLPFLGQNQEVNFVFLVLIPNDGITSSAKDWRESPDIEIWIRNIEKRYPEYLTIDYEDE